MKAGNLLEYEMVHVVNVNNGARFETYIIKGEQGSGTVCMNGAAARLAEPGDTIIIISWSLYSEAEIKSYRPNVVLVDGQNHQTG
jgi:aspartate 1-decarboxylase